MALAITHVARTHRVARTSWKEEECEAPVEQVQVQHLGTNLLKEVTVVKLSYEQCDLSVRVCMVYACVRVFVKEEGA